MISNIILECFEILVVRLAGLLGRCWRGWSYCRRQGRHNSWSSNQSWCCIIEGYAWYDWWLSIIFRWCRSNWAVFTVPGSFFLQVAISCYLSCNCQCVSICILNFICICICTAGHQLLLFIMYLPMYLYLVFCFFVFVFVLQVAISWYISCICGCMCICF